MGVIRSFGGDPFLLPYRIWPEVDPPRAWR